jgi:hypothetical protein
MVYALIEGLAGIVDRGKLYQNVRLSPRWLAAGRNEAHVSVVYGPSGAGFEYTFIHDDSAKTIQLNVLGNSEVDLHLLLPKGSKSAMASIDGKKAKSSVRRVEASPYVDTSFG